MIHGRLIRTLEATFRRVVTLVLGNGNLDVGLTHADGGRSHELTRKNLIDLLAFKTIFLAEN